VLDPDRDVKNENIPRTMIIDRFFPRLSAIAFPPYFSTLFITLPR
jgi:hypothetical protein